MKKVDFKIGDPIRPLKLDPSFYPELKNIQMPKWDKWDSNSVKFKDKWDEDNWGII